MILKDYITLTATSSLIFENQKYPTCQAEYDVSEIFNIFQKTLIDVDAYLTLLKGLWITIMISSLSLIAGTLLGAIICFFRMSKIKILRCAASAYIAILRGSPVLLLLMLMYYVVFAKSDLPAPFIAVAAFALNVSAHAAEVMRSASPVKISARTKPKNSRIYKIPGFLSHYSAAIGKNLPKPVYLSTVVNSSNGQASWICDHHRFDKSS